MLLTWVFSSNQGEGIAGGARILLSGTAEIFANIPGAKNASRIEMDHHNSQDMRDVIEESLNTRGLLQDTKPGSDRCKAREDIIEKLPQNVNGSYLLLKFAMDKITRTLSTRTAAQELHRILTESVNSHELAINELQRSLSAEDVGELNELLKWILYSEERLKVEELEAAMFLYSSVDSPLASLEYIITNKYSAILKLEDGYVYAQDDVASYLKKRTNDSAKALQSPDRPTISMTIKIDNIDQELCGHFFWDLAQQTIRQNFKLFNFDTASNTLDTSRHTIAVDEFNAHHTIVTRAFDYLDQQSTVQTQHIGSHLVFWLPYHLDRLRQLENEDKGTLMPSEKLRLGRNLYELFKNRETFARHLESFKPSYWTAKEMGQVKVWLMDSGIVRKLEPKWLNEIQRAVNPVRGFLKELVGTVLEGLLRDRSWDVSYVYAWIKEFMEADTQGLPETRNANKDDASSSSSSSSEIDWDQMSRWCQEYLGLPDSELNSLWYERLAEVASSQEGSEAETILRLCRKAVDQGSPSWLCYRSMGRTYFRLGKTSEAIKQVELALSEANQNGATPMDVASLHLLLGEYSHEADDAQKAADHYSQACLSEDEDQVRRGKFGQFKSTFNLADTEVKRDFLRGLLAEGNEEVAIVDMLRMTARDEDCDTIVSQMFAVSMGDVDLSRAIVQAMARATTNAVPMENRTSGSLSEIQFPEDESRGVLLYYLGIAAYKYNQVSTEGTEPISEAVRLWRECREQLSDVGGSNASVVQETATAELAKHYFQIMVDGKHLKKVDALSKLDDGDSDLRADPPALLGTLYALNGDQKSSRATLKSRMRNALQDLTDDIADNDPVGLYDMFCVLANSGDLKNAAMAIALQGQPDLVTEALSFDDEDIFDCDDADKERVLETITAISEEIVLAVKEQVPETSQQIPRIKVANDIIESRLATQEMNSGGAEDSGEEYRTDPVPATTLVAQGHLRDSLSDLQLWHTPELDEGRLQRVLSCDGLLPDGRRCNLDFGFEQGFFHCLYCSKIDFCGYCLERLRDPKDTVRIIACSAKHRWLRMPPFGHDMYVGPEAKTVNIPSEVRPMRSDERIFEAIYEQNGKGKKITVQEWKEGLAAQWELEIN